MAPGLRITPLWRAAAVGSAAAARVPVVRVSERYQSRPRGVLAPRRGRRLERVSRMMAAAAGAIADACNGLVVLDYRAPLPLFAAVAVALSVLSTVLVPDTALMRLAQPALRLTSPQATAREQLFRDVLAPSADARGHDVESGIDTVQFQRLQVRDYRLSEGDTLSGIASRNGLRIDTLASFNRITDARRIRAGNTLQIPNRDGLLHTVGRGESLSSIASRYGTTVNALLDANDLSSATITAGQALFVPDARMSHTDLQRVLGRLFIYPSNGRLTSGYGMRNDPFTGIRRFHNGIDLAAAVGTPVTAAMAGRVVHVENQPGNYGRFVILRHEGGYQTLYAHLDSYTVRPGQLVSQGQHIGVMGNTGRSTGPHLHFSIIKNGSFVDPMRYLR